MPRLARTPPPPYYAVIFSSLRSGFDPAGYEQTAARMLELAAQMPGFLGVDSARGDDGLGITVSYWESLAAIEAWGQETEHRRAQLGGQHWYEAYELRIAHVTSQRGFAGRLA